MLLSVVDDASWLACPNCSDYYSKACRIAALNPGRLGDWKHAAKWLNEGYELKFMGDAEIPQTLEMQQLTGKFSANWEE